MNITPSVFLEDGDLLKAYGVDAEVIALPGHTQGSIGIDCKEDCVIVGDALMNMFYPTVSMLYGNEKMMRQSAEKIKEMIDDLVKEMGHSPNIPIQKNKLKLVDIDFDNVDIVTLMQVQARISRLILEKSK